MPREDDGRALPEMDTRDLRGYTEVRESAMLGAGLGLFATRRIPRGTVWWRAGQDNVLCVTHAQYQCLRNSELARSPRSQALLRALEIYGYINDETGELVVALDDSRFVNHSATPNSIPAPHDPNDCSMAAVDIEPGDEITEDYRSYTMHLWSDLPDEPYLRD